MPTASCYKVRMGLSAAEAAELAARRARIMEAMDRLAALASDGDPAEGVMMRGLAAHFRQALVRGALGQAREAADVMRERSGSMLTPKKGR